jgi:hypothetical protein
MQQLRAAMACRIDMHHGRASWTCRVKTCIPGTLPVNVCSSSHICILADFLAELPFKAPWMGPCMSRRKYSYYHICNIREHEGATNATFTSGAPGNGTVALII